MEKIIAVKRSGVKRDSIKNPKRSILLINAESKVEKKKRSYFRLKLRIKS